MNWVLLLSIALKTSTTHKEGPTFIQLFRKGLQCRWKWECVPLVFGFEWCLCIWLDTVKKWVKLDSRICTTSALSSKSLKWFCWSISSYYLGSTWKWHDHSAGLCLSISSYYLGSTWQWHDHYAGLLLWPWLMHLQFFSFCI